jgi:hypothetical protein
VNRKQYDLLQVRDLMGCSLRKSSYRKLRLAQVDLQMAIFEIRDSEPCGRLRAIAAAAAASMSGMLDLPVRVTDWCEPCAKSGYRINWAFGRCCCRMNEFTV